LEDSGFIDLYFVEEGHFGITPNMPHTWQTKRNPRLLPAAKGKFLNVVGLKSHKMICSLKCMKQHSIPIALFNT